MKESKGKKETVMFFGWNLLSKAITYVVLLVLANIYSVEAYGEAVYALSIFGIVLIFLAIGLPDTFIGWFLKKRDATSVVKYMLIVSLIFVFLAAIFSQGNIIVYPLILALPFFILKGVGEGLFRINHKYHLVQVFGTLSMLLYLIFLLVLKSYQALGITLSFSLAYFLITLVMVYLLRNEFNSLFKSKRLNFKSFIDYCKKGFFTAFIAVSFSLLGLIDAFILGLFSSYSDVARYNISMILAGIVVVIPVALSMFMLTRAAELDSKKQTKPILERVMRISLFITLISIIFLVSIVNLVLKFFFPKYLGIEPFVMILSIGYIFFSLYYIIANYYAGRLEPEFIAIPIISAAGINVLLDIILIPKYGLYGITIATVIAHLLAMLLLVNSAKLWRYFLPIVVISLFVPLAFSLRYYGVLLIFLAVPLLFLLKLLTLEDVHILKDNLLKLIKRN